MIKVYIDGKDGTTGLRIYERLAEYKGIEIIHIDEALRKDANERRKKINESDITFLCLPDDAARESVSLCENEHTVIIDASTAHRTESDWAYGFPELSKLHREKIKNGKRIAVPGCHASGFTSIIYPLVVSDIMPNDYPVTCFSLSGYSGAGKKAIAQYESDERPLEFDSPRLYALTQAHKHLKEMKFISSLEREPVFSPIICDYYSGMSVNIPLVTSLLNGNQTVESITAIYKNHYKDEPLVRVMDNEEAFLGANRLSGKDYMEIRVFGNADRITVCSLFDNLGKGASGAAIQCMNISAGFEETKGLVLQ